EDGQRVWGIRESPQAEFWAMAKYLATRLAGLFPVLLGASVIAFLIIHLVPGDPALAFLGLEADDAAIAALRHHLALDQPLLVQCGTWLSQILTGDFGRSIEGGRAVLPLLIGALGPTAILGVSALAIALALAVPAGILAALRRNGPADYAVS